MGKRRQYFNTKKGGGGGPSSKKGKRNQLEPGVKGFLATTSTNDAPRCVREMYDLLNQYMDRMEEEKSAGDQVPQSDQIDHSSISDDDQEEDIEAALKKECDTLAGRGQTDDDQGQSKSMPPKRFQSLDTGVPNNVFVCTSMDLDPCQVVHGILSDAKKNGQCPSRYIQRFLPVEITCKAYVDDIERTLQSNQDLLKKHFASIDPNSNAPTYAIFYKCRNNDHMKREDVFRVVNELVQATNPLVNVDLEKPKKAILVEILKLVACISIVDDYIDLCKYNLHAVGNQ